MIEIGCIELINRIPSGQVFHRYINPERDIPPDVVAIHGIDNARVQKEKVFAEIVDELVAFLGDAPLVAHNAAFDLGFLNAELDRCQRQPLGRERLVDTLMLARRKYPGGSNRLDDLCTRYRIDNSHRTKHGALLDAELLAEVYLELIDARQASLVLVEAVEGRDIIFTPLGGRQRPQPLRPRLTVAEQEAHRIFIASLGGDVIWKHYLTMSATSAAEASAPAA
jgi:DNA polymerase-3 subunit epsilon